MSTTYYLKSGNTYRVASKDAMDLHEILPAANYVLAADHTGNLFLKIIESFEINHKLYGDVKNNTHRILYTFMDREASTGVLLAGEKGSGKSLLAKNIVIEAAKQNIPTLIINAAWKGDGFNDLLQHISQPCVVLFDEFEKVYDKDDQQEILTLLDGVFPSKKLFILTCNDKWRIDANMRNRPGRIFYALDFNGLDDAFIREYCDDNLKDKKYIEKLIQVTSTFDVFNFDMLKSLVEEMNRFNEPVNVALRMLNVKPEFGGKCEYTCKVINNENVTVVEETYYGNPLFEEFSFNYFIKTNDDDEDEYTNAMFTPRDLKMIDPTGSKLVFTNNDKQTVILAKVREKTVNYLDMF